jgi:hypothetical protein
MNDIELAGTAFNVKEINGKKTFRIGFYNGKNAKGEFNPSGYIDCKTTKNTAVNVDIADRAKVAVKGFLACDYWEYQGKKYSQLTIVASSVDKDRRFETSVMDKAWGEPVVKIADDEIPF